MRLRCGFAVVRSGTSTRLRRCAATFANFPNWNPAMVTTDQRLNALKNANRARISRAGVRADLASGERKLEDVLGAPDECLQTMPIWQLLSWGRKVGLGRVNRVLRRADVWPLRQVGHLTARQRADLILELGKK